MIDFHVLHRPEKSPFFGDAVSSLHDASVLTQECVSTFAKSRMEMYKCGHNPYVSFCDDDDSVQNIKSVVDYVKEHGNVNALYTNSNIIDETGRVLRQNYKPDHQWNKIDLLAGKFQIHQLVVIKRDLAVEAAERTYAYLLENENDSMFDFVFFLEIATLTDWVYFPHTCYNWRLWNSNLQLHYTSDTAKRRDEILFHYTNKTLGELNDSVK